jgi:bifunctional non-homologous end joining protein LigD
MAPVLDQLEQPRVTRLEVGDVSVRVSHLERVLWPATDEHPAFTKRDLLKYLVGTADYLLPHLCDRPLTLNRYPTGLNGKHFFQKHVETALPPFVERVRLYAEQHGTSGDHVVCNNLPTLIWLGQMANLELHPWQSRINPETDARGRPLTFSDSLTALEASVVNFPDFMVFDLDPYVYAGLEQRGDEPILHREGFRRTCQAASWLKDVLDELGLRSFVKTSGKTGLHVFVPILRHFDYATVRQMAEQISRFLLRRHPDQLTTEWSIERRKDKIFLDYNQNTRGKTLASAYSPRAAPGAPVSAPLEWTELDLVYPADFTLRTVHARLARVGDLWQDILSAKNDLTALVERQPV